MAEATGEPLSAAVYTGDYACGALAMAQADADDQAEAAQLVATAGTVDPYSAFAMSAQPDGHVRVVLAFADDDQARTNADSRSVLATGPAVGQGGDFADRFSLASAEADGSLVTLDLQPVEGQYVLSDLSTGPVLFATCCRPPQRKLRSRRLLVTTRTLEAAIAAPAIIGVSRPAAASGMAATL